jgi:hypothetical protein
MIRNIFLLVGLLSLGACASPADRSNMTVGPTAGLERPTDISLVGAVAIGRVEGGEETNPLWTSQVGSEDFRGALTDSLRNHGLLAESGAPRYVLNGHLLGLQQPMFGANMTVTSAVNYELVDAVAARPLTGETVQTPYTAKWNDAFVGVTRLRLANEGAIRENIKEYLERLYRKPPTDVPVASTR